MLMTKVYNNNYYVLSSLQTINPWGVWDKVQWPTPGGYAPRSIPPKPNQSALLFGGLSIRQIDIT